jgi:putative tryptophan/tyrosine transport system ATP-binding protein
MLKVSHLKKSYDQRAILNDISLTACEGQLTILEGQNGAGKSTLFGILVGIIPSDGGTILLHGVEQSTRSAIKRAHSIAILQQDPKSSSAPSLSVVENCALALLKQKRASLKSALSQKTIECVARHLESLGLDFAPQLYLPMGQLSGGQRQILAFAMATINRPQLLLLDEPTAALDENSSHLLMRLIKKMIKIWQIPALMISHDHALNQQYGDQIIQLVDGVIAGAMHPA